MQSACGTTTKTFFFIAVGLIFGARAQNITPCTLIGPSKSSSHLRSQTLTPVSVSPHQHPSQPSTKSTIMAPLPDDQAPPNAPPPVPPALEVKPPPGFFGLAGIVTPLPSPSPRSDGGLTRVDVGDVV
jgi:hypothetical protein